MSEAISALGGARYSGSIRIEDGGLRGMATIRGDLSDGAVKETISAAAGVDVPDVRKAQFDGETGLLWMSPDELLLVCPYTEARSNIQRLSDGLADLHHLVVDVSDARAFFHLVGEGPAIRETLAKLSPADLRAASMPVGEVRRTRLAQVPAAFWFRESGVAELICFRSVADYVFRLLSNAGKPGSEVGYFSSD